MRVEIVMDEKFNKANCYECAEVTIQKEDGWKRKRIVTVESLIESMNGSFRNKLRCVEVGKIPFGYYGAKVGEDQGKLCGAVITVFPASRQMIKYENTLYDVCIPTLVFRFCVNKEYLSTTYVYATDDKNPTDKSRIYAYPFGNVNCNGAVCWGTNRLPLIKELKTLESVMMLFIQSPGNDDYYEPERCCGHKDITLRQLFEKIKDEEKYPADYLVPKKRGKEDMLLKDLMEWQYEN